MSEGIFVKTVLALRNPTPEDKVHESIVWINVLTGKLWLQGEPEPWHEFSLEKITELVHQMHGIPV